MRRLYPILAFGDAKPLSASFVGTSLQREAFGG
jgi:hypothetical protein